MKMRKLLLSVFLGLLAVVHSTPVNTVTHVPIESEDVFREAMTDGFLVPSLTTETPETQSTTEVSQQTSTESSSTAADVSRDSVLPLVTTESPKTNTSAQTSQQPDSTESEETEGSAAGVTDSFWNGGDTTTTSTQETKASSATESTTSGLDSTELPTESTTSEFDPTELPTESTTSWFDAAELPTESTTSEFDHTELPTESMTSGFDATELPTESTTSGFDATELPTESTTSEYNPTELPTESMTSGFDPTDLPAESTSVKASQLPFSEYMMEGSASGAGEDSTTSSLYPDHRLGDEELIISGRRNSVGSGPRIFEEPAKSTTIEGRLIQKETPAKVNSPNPDPEQHKGHSTPGWIIIVGFVVGVAALVMLCLAIATRDKWNGPNQASATKTKSNPSDQQRELEMETFLHTEEPKENGKAAEYTVIPLDELSESYS